MYPQSRHAEPDAITTMRNGNGNGNGSSSSSNTPAFTVADAGRPRRPCKLRQTCDPCSEAKVKCDKGNPRCGRCDRLSYDCVYSPARRIGRPRPRSRRSPRSPDRDFGAHPAYSVRDDRDDRDVVMTDEASSKDYTVVPAPSGSALAQPGQQTSMARHPSPNLHESLAHSLFDEGRSQTAPIGASVSNRSSVGSNDVSQPVTITRDANINSNLEQPSSSGSMDKIHHSPYEYDCAIVALATLRRLAAAGPDGQQPASKKSVAAEVLADQIPHACRRAARILVCPCSTDMDTALLAASLVDAIIDVADAAMRTLKPAGQALDDQEHTVLTLGTLPAISQVVTLFTHRYSATQASRPPEALPLLAASLRTTLRTMAEETTKRLLDCGTAAPTSC